MTFAAQLARLHEVLGDDMDDFDPAAFLREIRGPDPAELLAAIRSHREAEAVHRGQMAAPWGSDSLDERRVKASRTHGAQQSAARHLRERLDAWAAAHTLKEQDDA